MKERMVFVFVSETSRNKKVKKKYVDILPDFEKGPIFWLQNSFSGSTQIFLGFFGGQIVRISPQYERRVTF